MISHYYDEKLLADRVAQGRHRGTIGGLWDEMGALQLGYLKAQGLTPEMKLLDVGCGCLRGGVGFVDYLNAGNYYGIDLSQTLLDAGYDIELAQAGLQEKLPRDHLQATDCFEAAGFGARFDMALATSVFTHLPLNHFTMCLFQLARVMDRDTRFYATAFQCPDGHDWTQNLAHTPGTIITKPDRDPFHYRMSDLKHACSGTGWTLLDVADWNHPRNQKMCVFERL